MLNSHDQSGTIDKILLGSEPRRPIAQLAGKYRIVTQVQVNKREHNQKQALVAFGANLPQGTAAPAESVKSAIDMLEARAGATLGATSGATLVRSRLWQTPAYPEGSGPPFVNAAVSFYWQDTARALLDLLHEVEDAFGRRRTNRWEARKMDLDLLALGDHVLPDVTEFRSWHDLSPQEAATRTPDSLIVPHPRMSERGFVLAPLAEVAADWRHPVLALSVQEMLAALPTGACDGMVPLDPHPGMTAVTS
jgi:2-amino-4-hydroxy-6-hydroxymethyldihydropteridine diphosphokinase